VRRKQKGRNGDHHGQSKRFEIKEQSGDSRFRREETTKKRKREKAACDCCSGPNALLSKKLENKRETARQQKQKHRPATIAEGEEEIEKRVKR